jgi:hypothetical protein
MDKSALLTALENSGAKSVTEKDFEGLLSKLTFLEKIGRYGKLLASIESSNDKSNFFACVLEATFAYQFETAGKPLEYEVQQDKDNPTKIDFARNLESGDTLYFEARLLQQDKPTSASIEKQLQASGTYRVAKCGAEEADDIVRLQRVILSKVQKADGTPIKFSQAKAGAINVVVVDISGILLRQADVFDCLLAAHGDPAVDKVYRRGIFGLFQEFEKEHPERIQNLATLHAHFRNTVHGVLFVFKDDNADVLGYRLEQYLVWNTRLVNSEQMKAAYGDIASAIPQRSERKKQKGA